MLVKAVRLYVHGDILQMQTASAEFFALNTVLAAGPSPSLGPPPPSTRTDNRFSL